MRKIAKDSPAWFLVPGHRFFFGADPDTRKLPKVFSDDADNTMLWSVLGATASTGALTALLTKLADKRAKDRLNKKQREVHAAKVESLYPATEADVTAIPKAANELSAAHTVVPLTAAILTGVGVNKLVSRNDEKAYAAELDAKIAAQRKKLQKLYAELEQVYSSGDNQTISKAASGQNIAGSVLTLAALGLLGAGVGGALASYYYTKKHDDAESEQKVLESDLLADNLTNIPDTIAMQLDPRRK